MNNKVGMAEYKIAKYPEELMIIGLGSCIGVGIYERECKICGLSHIMLPDSTIFLKSIKEEKFADLAIPKMVNEISKMIPGNRNLVAKIAGGASMFNFPDKKKSLDIGQRNIIAVEKALIELNIPIISKDVGGNTGRTMIVNMDNFKIKIKTINNIKTI